MVICFSRASQLRHNPLMVVSFLLVEAIKQRLDVHPSVIQLLGQVLKNEWKSARQREKLSKWCQSWRCDEFPCVQRKERAGLEYRMHKQGWEGNC